MVNNSLVFSNCYFRLRKKRYLQNFCLLKKWMMLEIFDEKVFKFMALPDSLVHICRFQGHNLVFCSLPMIRGISVFRISVFRCHRVGKQGRVIVKFLRRKDCQKVLYVKKDIQKIFATDSDLPNATIKLYLKRAFFPITLSYGQKEKYYVHWVKYIAILFQMDQLKYIYKIGNLQFQLHVQLILKSIFLVWTSVLQGRLGLPFNSFFTVVFLMV